MSNTPHDQNGIVLNQRTIPSIVGAIAIVTSVYYFFEKVNTYENRLSRIEHSDTLRTDEIKELTGEIKKLNEYLTKLTIEIREMRVMTQTQQERTK